MFARLFEVVVADGYSKQSRTKRSRGMSVLNLEIMIAKTLKGGKTGASRPQSHVSHVRVEYWLI